MKVLPTDSVNAMDFARAAFKGTDWEIKCRVWLDLTNPSNIPDPFRAIEDVNGIIDSCGMTVTGIRYTNNDDEVPVIDVVITKLILGEMPGRQIRQCLEGLRRRMLANDRINSMQVLDIKMARLED